jgi:hypothetical protein
MGKDDRSVRHRADIACEPERRQKFEKVVAKDFPGCKPGELFIMEPRLQAELKCILDAGSDAIPSVLRNGAKENFKACSLPAAAVDPIPLEHGQLI